MRKLGIVVVASFMGACSVRGPVSGPELVLQVAPLALPDVVDACYGLAVLNEAGDPVWSKGGLCASRFGDGATDLAYVGTCDATDLDQNGTASATVVLTIEGLYGADTAQDGDADPDLLTDWKNPCAAPYAPDGCRLVTACRENADVPVTFNLTIMRQAQQGFFDVAVNFEDIFCSAKVDCAYPATDNAPARPIEVVFDPATGKRTQSVVWAFACTDGDPGGDPDRATHLYMDDLVLRCGDDTYAIDPSQGPGNLYPEGVGAPAPLVQAMVFEGRELITNGGADADKLYWNVALGLRPSFFDPATGTPPDCVLETRATASKGPFADSHSPDNASYPYVSVSMPINVGRTLVCTQHPLDGAAPHAGVATAYTAPRTDGSGFTSIALGFVAHASGGSLATEPVSAPVAECAIEGICPANSHCIERPVGYLCACDDGFVMDQGVCVALDPCLGVSCGAHAACVAGTCTCDPGYSGDPDLGCALGVVAACKELRAQGNTESRVYAIAGVDTYCDMATDGGGWTKLFSIDSSGNAWFYQDPNWTSSEPTTFGTPTASVGDYRSALYGRVLGKDLMIRKADTPTEYIAWKNLFASQTLTSLFGGAYLDASTHVYDLAGATLPQPWGIAPDFKGIILNSTDWETGGMCTYNLRIASGWGGNVGVGFDPKGFGRQQVPPFLWFMCYDGNVSFGGWSPQGRHDFYVR
jgi:hypothetical protein